MRRARGHNMLEMVLAVVLFSTVVVSLIGVWGTYSRAIGKARSVLVATYLGEELMENCIAAKDANIVIFAAGYPSPNPVLGDPRGSDALASNETEIRTITTRAMIRSREVLTVYKVWVDLTPRTTTPGGTMIGVTVTVEWTERLATEVSSTRNADGDIAKGRSLKFNTMISSNS